MGIAFTRRNARPLAVSVSSFIGRLLGRLRVTRSAADEIDFRNELLARLGKTD
ncbi:MAG TPA: hypothetical protein PK756_14185 [Piscinibacter sp.]|nr:hypothetical protein [Piscinibacter sp.]